MVCYYGYIFRGDNISIIAKWERKIMMYKKVNFTWLSDKLILFLFVISMLLTKKIKVADFPIYSLLLFLSASGWMAAKVLLCQKEGQAFGPIRYWTDLMVILLVFYEAGSVVIKLFQNPDKGAIDFSGNAEMLAFAVFYFCLSSGVRFRQVYFDLILYGGLLYCAAFLFPHFTGTRIPGYGSMLLEDGGGGFLFSVGQYGWCLSILFLRG